MNNKLYKNKYRIPSNGLQVWDYPLAGAYFITICIKNHECLFGDVVNNKFVLAVRYFKNI